MFPVTDKARTILEAFIEELKRLQVQIRTNIKVERILIENGQGYRCPFGRMAKSSRRIGSFWQPVERPFRAQDPKAMAISSPRAAGHTITELYPTEAPITSDADFIRSSELKGLSLRNVAFSIKNKKGKTVVSHQMDMIFTHFGVSGPAALRCSMFVHQTMKRDKTETVTMSLDVLPELSLGAVEQQLQKLIKAQPEKSVKNGWKDLMPERYLLVRLQPGRYRPAEISEGIDAEGNQSFRRLLQKFLLRSERHASFG